jgi:beta-N-acetylhexosaminidase
MTIPHQPTRNDMNGVIQAVSDAKTVIVGTINADAYPEQAAVVRALLATGKQVIVVALRTPYDIVAFPEIQTYLCAYGIRDVTTEAAAKVLFGEITATGVLPCEIPGIQPTYAVIS